MEPYRDKPWASPRHSPAPLALQDFMSQNALTISTQEGSVSRLDTTAAEAEVQSSSLPPSAGIANKPTPLSQEVMSIPGGPEAQGPDIQERVLEQDEPDQGQPADEEMESEAPVNWKAIRVQIPLGKKANKKTEWIRGWSEEIGAHGDDVYCACSGPLPGRSPLFAPLKSNHSRASTGQSDRQDAQSDEGEPLPPCRNCCRPSSPTELPMQVAEEHYNGRAKGLRKKMSGLVMRVIKGRKAPGPGPGLLGPDSVIRDTEPEPEKGTEPKTRAEDHELVGPDDLSSSDDDRSPRGRKVLKERQERLARAQELLNRHRS